MTKIIYFIYNYYEPKSFCKAVIIIKEKSLSRPTSPAISIADAIDDIVSLLKIGLCDLISYHVEVWSK